MGGLSSRVIQADETRAIELMKSLGFTIAFEAMATRFQRANPLEMMPIDLPNFSNHPAPPRLTLEQYEKWVFEMHAKSKYPTMSKEEMQTEWLRNEGSQKEEWPDFGTR
jgi:hypothetical protein